MSDTMSHVSETDSEGEARGNISQSTPRQAASTGAMGKRKGAERMKPQGGAGGKGAQGTGMKSEGLGIRRFLVPFGDHGSNKPGGSKGEQPKTGQVGRRSTKRICGGGGGAFSGRAGASYEPDDVLSDDDGGDDDALLSLAASPSIGDGMHSINTGTAGAANVLPDSTVRECTICRETKKLTDFTLTSASAGPGGRRYLQCSTCRVSLDRDRRHAKKNGSYVPPDFKSLTPEELATRAMMRKLVDGAKSSTKLKSATRNIGPCTIKVDQLVEMMAAQNQKCSLTGLDFVLSQEPGIWNKPSLERLNNANGYNIDNVTLILMAFNTPFQWTKKKIDLVFGLSSLGTVPAGVSQVAKQMEVAMFKSERSPKFVLRQSPNTAINDTDPPTRAWHLRFKSLFHGAKTRCDRRQKKGRCEASAIDITYLDVCDMFVRQGGLCAYSGAVLTAGPDMPYQMSIERRNPDKGYTKANTCLVIVEFQTGMCTWSAARVEEVRKHMQGNA